jgi:hypothetical protein
LFEPEPGPIERVLRQDYRGSGGNGVECRGADRRRTGRRHDRPGVELGALVQHLRTIGGGVAGQQVTRLASNQQAFEYTVLLGGTNTITMVTDQSGLRVGDCVSVERGAFNNLRLVDDARCAPNARPATADVRGADACLNAKNALFEAQTEEAFNVAERRVRLLCD